MLYQRAARAHDSRPSLRFRAGPILLEDMHMINKNAQFNREKVPERVVHARGMTAKGFFEASAPMRACSLHRALTVLQCRQRALAVVASWLHCSSQSLLQHFLVLRRAVLCWRQVTDDITDLTEADVFSEVGKQVSYQHVQLRAASLIELFRTTSTSEATLEESCHAVLD
jgi:Catalase